MTISGIGGLTFTASEADITVRVGITDTGSRRGREVVQVYTALPGSSVTRPARELKGVAVTAEPEPGAREEISMPLRGHDLAYWVTRVDRWIVEGGAYRVWAGATSRDLRVSGLVDVAEDELRIPITAESTLGEALADPRAAAALADVFGGMSESMGEASALGVDMMRMIASVPLNRLTGFGVDPQKLDALLAATGD